MVVLQVHVSYEFMIEMDPLMSENQVKKSWFCVTSPLLPWLRGRGVTTHAYHDHDFAYQFGDTSSPRYQHYEAPTNEVDVEVVDDGNRVAIKPMTPHYEAPTSKGCSSISTPKSKIEKCIEVDAKDDAGNSSVKVETKKKEKRMARELVKRAACCKSPFI